MKFFVVDFESYYDQDYSLRNMTPLEYVADPRFEMIMCSVRSEDGTTIILEHHEFLYFIEACKQEKVCFISHNALFDMLIMSMRYNYLPDLMIDTMGIARAMLKGKCRSVALAFIGAFLGFKPKGTTVHSVKGMNKAAIKAAGLWDAYCTYCAGDAEICQGIWLWALANGFPFEEWVTMDQVIRMAVTPNWTLDAQLLAEYHAEVIADKANLVTAAGLANRDDLMSDAKLAGLLLSRGITPPMKKNLKGKEIYAFAKTDLSFTELQEHPDPMVANVVAARLGVKSTIEETRSKRFLDLSLMQWPDGDVGKMTFPLAYSGAHTHRLSGDWSLNMQNLKRGGKLRRALTVKKGSIYVGADASQIECRTEAAACGVEALLAKFRNKEDVYASFASSTFSIPALTKHTHPLERFIGKTAVLGLGYNLGWLKFKGDVKVKAKTELNRDVDISDEESARIVNDYRTTYYQIPAAWKLFQSYIPQMCRRDCDIPWGPVRFQYQSILLPNGMRLFYEGLQYNPAAGQWMYVYGGKPKYLYGGKIMENIIQALSRIMTMSAARRVTARTGYRLALQVHDEIGYVVPLHLEDWMKAVLLEEMIVVPYWLPNIPLAAEAGSGFNYGDAK